MSKFEEKRGISSHQEARSARAFLFFYKPEGTGLFNPALLLEANKSLGKKGAHV